MLSGAVFVDAGNLWYDNTTATLSDAAALIRPSDFRYNVGAGIRLKLPIGIVRLDGGFNLDPRSGESVGAIHVDMGQAF